MCPPDPQRRSVFPTSLKKMATPTQISRPGLDPLRPPPQVKIMFPPRASSPRAGAHDPQTRLVLCCKAGPKTSPEGKSCVSLVPPGAGAFRDGKALLESESPGENSTKLGSTAVIPDSGDPEVPGNPPGGSLHPGAPGPSRPPPEVGGEGEGGTNPPCAPSPPTQASLSQS